MVFTEVQEDGAAGGRNREKGLSKPIPTNPRFLHFLWLLAIEILN